ncbi:MAG: alpha-hydroxy-acid oxidizing protein [Burkholderiales bacterium]|nr:alpha-hydroxy-acid oxidizing protein [Burkholderiales bacterium]
MSAHAADDARAASFLTLQEVVAAARSRLTPGTWAYLVGGTETEATVRRNRQALDALAFRPRVLNDVRDAQPVAACLGRPVRLPVFLAPVGGVEAFVDGGAATSAQAAAGFGVPLMLSSVCQPGLEATAQAADAQRIFQLYVRGDDAWVDDWVRRARDNGYQAFCLTVDSAYYSRRERDIIGRYAKPWRPADSAGLAWQSALSWREVARFKDKWDLPLILKGIATAEDAALAVDHGVDVVYVSNHGGRQLDCGLGSIAVLPEVVAAVAGRAQVWVDGGAMRGSDVLKALALGASMVGIGRLACLGLAAAGVPGLMRTLEILEEEMRLCLGLLGVTRVAQLTTRHLAAAPPVADHGVLGAFPLLDTHAPPEPQKGGT